jgi:hypothetical protein
MKPFPSFDRLAFFIGAKLSNITLQPYSIDITFVDGTRLVSEHRIEYVDQHGRVSTHNTQNRHGPDPFIAHALIGDRVAQILVEPYRLTLVFESDRRLVVLSETGPYESGHIWRGGMGTGLVVF